VISEPSAPTNDRCTDSVLVTSVTVCGDHTVVAYSNKGRTYVTKALSSVLRCLEWKHLKIKLALVQAFLTVQLCCDIVNLLSIKMPRSHITETTDARMLNFIRLINIGLAKVQYCRFFTGYRELLLIGPSYKSIEATL